MPRLRCYLLVLINGKSAALFSLRERMLGFAQTHQREFLPLESRNFSRGG